MTRELLGPGDIWGSPLDGVAACECGLELATIEYCTHERCEQCSDAVGCCVECSECKRLVADDSTCSHGVCDDCPCSECEADEDLAARQAENDRRERDEAMLEDKGDEIRERDWLADACREWREAKR